MSLAYQIMYRLGVTPWEHREPPEPLAGLIEGPRSLPPGDLLDKGGTRAVRSGCPLPL
jgi:hypothetical protein